MYAIIQSGGKQHKVSEGDVIRVEKMEGDVGKAVEIRDVLFVSKPDGINVGSPSVEGARVKAEIVDQGKRKKIIVLAVLEMVGTVPVGGLASRGLEDRE